MVQASEFKFSLDKLKGVEDWTDWKWQMGMLFREHGLESIVYGFNPCPEPAATRAASAGPSGVGDDSLDVDLDRKKWLRKDAKAASLIASALSKNIEKLEFTSVNANEI